MVVPQVATKTSQATSQVMILRTLQPPETTGPREYLRVRLQVWNHLLPDTCRNHPPQRESRSSRLATSSGLATQLSRTHHPLRIPAPRHEANHNRQPLNQILIGAPIHNSPSSRYNQGSRKCHCMREIRCMSALCCCTLARSCPSEMDIFPHFCFETKNSATCSMIELIATKDVVLDVWCCLHLHDVVLDAWCCLHLKEDNLSLA